MALQKRVLISIGLTLAFLMALLFISSHMILTRSLLMHEQGDVYESVDRVQYALDDELTNLNGITSDWAAWDLTYNFVDDPNDEFPGDTIDLTFIHNRLNLLLVINSSGKIVFGKGFDLQTQKQVSLPKSLTTAYFSAGSPLTSYSDPKAGVSGIIMLPEGPMLISGRGILRSDGTGPPRGTLIMGRYLNPSLENHLSDLTHLAFTIQPYDSSRMDSFFKAISSVSSGKTTVFIHPQSAESIAGYTLLKDIYGRPNILLEAIMPRDLYQQGRMSMIYFLLSLLAIALVFSVVILKYINSAVLSRLRQLSANVRQIAMSGDNLQRVAMGGNDELSSLADDINEMLNVLEKSRCEVYASEARHRRITDNMHDMIRQTDAKGIIQYSSPSYKIVMGYEPEELLGKSALDYIHPDDRGRARTAFMELIDTASAGKLEYRSRHSDGHYLWVEAMGKPLFDDEGRVIGAIFGTRDVTERRQMEERLKYLSFHDILTDLYNRSFFEEELVRLDTSRQIPISIIMGDINGLKIVNDTLGHHVGDQLLVSAGKILKKACRHEEIICRWGGDEYAILLPKTNKDTVKSICNRISKACEETEGEQIPLSFALGAATKEHEDQTLEGVLREAEDLMYRDKLLDSRSTRFSMITFFQRALAKKSLETVEHGKRIQNLVIKMGSRIGLSSREKDELDILATLHDIGQIAIPGDLLVKPCYLTAEEWELMQKHPEIGGRIARSVPDLFDVAEAILSHHEYWDGTGYPRGLKGEQIPLLARILAIADAYDVMTNGRPYKKAISHGEAMEEIKKCSGTQFDPALVKLFTEVI